MTENNTASNSNSTESTFSVVPPAARRLRSSQRVNNNEVNTATNTTTTTTTGNAAAGSTAAASSSGLSSVGPIRAKQSRVKGESTSKRKEQNRVAQRAFRKRQKVYFYDLEREVAEKSEKIQVIWKSNAYLVEVMQRLQEENIELKKGRAPNMHFSVDGSNLHCSRSATPDSTFGRASINVDTPTLTETLLPNKGKGRHVHHHPESDEELVSVNDLVSRSGGFGNGMGKQDDSASGNSPSPLNHFNSKSLAHHQSQSRPYPQGQGQTQQGINFSRPSMTPILKSNSISSTGQSDLRRASGFSYHSSEGSRASGSVVDSMTELDSPAYSYGVQDRGLDRSSSSAARSGGYRDYDTFIRDLQQIQSKQEQMGSRSSRSSEGPGIVIRDPVQDRKEQELAQEQERVQVQGEEAKTRARRYSEALRKHHSGPLFNQQQQQQQQQPPQQGYTLPNANPSAESSNTFSWNSQSSQQNQDTGNPGDLAWTNSWTWAQDVSASQQQGQSEKSQIHSQRQQPQGQVQQGVPVTATGNSSNFNKGWVPEGLKSDSNGGMMPFTGVLTPLDGGLGVGVSTDFPWPTYTAHWDVPEKVHAVLEDQNSTAFGYMGSYFVDSPTSSPFAGMI